MTILIIALIVVALLWYWRSTPDTYAMTGGCPSASGARSNAPAQRASATPPLNPARVTQIDGYYDFARGKADAAYGNLCLTCKPYGNKSDVYWWFKLSPYYWQKQYQHCDKYGCGGSHDKSLCPQPFKPLDCADVKNAPYTPVYDDVTEKCEPNDKMALFFQNRASYCGKYPNDSHCPNHFADPRLRTDKSDPKEPWSTTPVGA